MENAPGPLTTPILCERAQIPAGFTYRVDNEPRSTADPDDGDPVKFSEMSQSYPG